MSKEIEELRKVADAERDLWRGLTDRLKSELASARDENLRLRRRAEGDERFTVSIISVLLCWALFATGFAIWG